jgi:predicted DNA-binding helix-hairpin-helix protein
VDVNRAPRESLLRIPGLGVKNATGSSAPAATRRCAPTDLARLRLPMAKLRPFISWRTRRPAPCSTAPTCAAC